MTASLLKKTWYFLGEKSYPKDELDMQVFNCHSHFSVRAT